MSSKEESQPLPSLSDMLDPNKNVNPEQNNLRLSLKESVEVNDKITELITEKHSNDINEGKDENDTKIINKNFLDRIKKKGKDDNQLESLDEIIKNEDKKENEKITTLPSISDLKYRHIETNH